MNTSEIPGWESLAGQPLDAQDAVIMDRIALLFATGDPVPDGLVDRLQFGITLDALNAELAELQAIPLAMTAARGAEQATEVKSLTFTSDSLTTMITISPDGPERVRIDGWAAPGAALHVELHQGSDVRETAADEDGRFVFADIPHGLTHFVLRPPTPADHPPVMTPNVEI
jgi:hypothetical protein